VAEIVVTSAALVKISASTDDVPANVCVAVKVLATLTTAMLAPARVVAPVPPLAIGKAVPDKVTAKVPLDVIGLPATDKNVGTVIATLETVAEDAALDANNLTVPALFLKYSFSSRVLSANSPATRFPDVGAAAAVVL
jgi:hypothetical protein